MAPDRRPEPFRPDRAGLGRPGVGDRGGRGGAGRAGRASSSTSRAVRRGTRPGLKPDAPAEIRGEFRPIATSVPGLFVGELMPQGRPPGRPVQRPAGRHDPRRLARLERLLHADGPPAFAGQYRDGPGRRRPTTSPASARSSGTCGRAPGLCRRRSRCPRRMIGNDFAVPPGQDAGFLGQKADPWLLNCDLADAGLPVPDLGLPADVPPLRSTAGDRCWRRSMGISTPSTGADSPTASTPRTGGRSTCSPPRRPGARSTSTRRIRGLATATAGTDRPGHAAGPSAGRGGRRSGQGQLAPREGGHEDRTTPSGTRTRTTPSG